MHKGPQASPAGLCVCTDRTDAGNVCKIWNKLKPSPRGKPLRVKKPPSGRQTPPIRGRWRLRQRGSGGPKGRRERALPLPETFVPA